MALIKCSECGREISDKAEACPGCGAPVEVAVVPPEGQAEHVVPAPFDANAQKHAQRQVYIGVLIVIAVVAVLGVFANKMGHEANHPADPAAIARKADADERDRMQQTIEYCEERYKEINADRQYTPDMLRFHSMACQKLRDDFRAKWGRYP